jgi:hypothetical protein
LQLGAHGGYHSVELIDFGGEVVDDEVGGVDGLCCFPVGLQRSDVILNCWNVGRVGSVEAASGALEADGACLAAGFDVGGFGAVAVRDGH